MDRPSDMDGRLGSSREHAGGVELVGRLRRVRGAVRRALVVRALGTGVGVGVGAVLLLVVLDFLLRLPTEIRIGLWVGGVAGIGVWVWRVVVPGLRFRPPLSDLALRVERTDSGRERALTDLLASGLELSGGEAGAGRRRERDEIESALGARVIERAVERVRGLSAGSVVRGAPMRRGLGVAGIALGVVATIALSAPQWGVTGARRVLTPWSEASWPKRTLVVDATDAGVHEMGVDLVLRALIERTPRAEGETRVEARVRRVDGEDAGERLLMSSLGAGEDGEIYAGRVPTPEPSADGPEEIVYEYWFESGDDRTGRRRVRVVAPPEVVRATVEIEPPGYALAASAEEVASGRFDLGASGRGRGVVEGVLAGSRMKLELEYSKPARAIIDPDRDAGAGAASGDALARAVREAADERAPVRVDRRPRGVEIEAVLGSTVALELALIDEHGLRTRPDREGSYRVDVVRDERASVAITEPAYDEAVLASAVIDVGGRAQDDVALEWLEIETRRLSAPAGSAGAPAEPVEEWASLVRAAPEGGEASARLDAVASVDLGELGVEPGDELRVRARAKEAYELFGAGREASVSEQRVLRVIAASELSERIREELEVVRDQAKRLDEQQEEVARRTEQEARSRGVRRQQQRVASRVGASRRAVERLEARVQRNRLDDPALAGLTREAREALEAAERAAQRAEGGLEAVGDQNEREAAETTERVREEQERVRDELARVVEMLDRGQDGWLVRQSLERLTGRQRELMERTERAGAESLGREAGELSAEQRSELERIADRQRELAREAASLLDEMSERARQLREADAAQSAGMRRAAESGRQEGLSEQLRRAGEEIAQNQSTSATGRQRRAVETMEQMLEEIERSAARRDEVLRRMLADVIGSLDRLIESQEEELGILRRARAGGGPEGLAMGGLDRAMIELHANTLALADEVRRGDATLRPVVSLIERAGAAQSEAIGALRSDPPDGGAAEAGEIESLERLVEAKAEAERLQEEAAQRDRARKRRELRRAYASFLEEQVALRGEVESLAGLDRLGRREKRSARTLGEKQATLRERVGELESEASELEDAMVFAFAHDRLGESMGGAASRLRRAEEVALALRDQSASVRVLQSIVEALREERGDEDGFRQGGGGGGGGGGSQQERLIPPVAELKLLRSMQAEALERTKVIRDLPADLAEAELREVGRLQSELSRIGRRTIERMNQQGGEGPGRVIEPMDKRGDER